VFHFEKPYGKSQKNFKFGLTKENLSAKRKLLQENVFRPLTVKITDKYETQTDKSDSPSENKRTKIYERKTHQSMIENLDAFTTKLKSKISFGVLKTINRSE
jgi:uncharacterized FlaG/YvyC family protein